jgi:acyl carrier protein
LQARLDLWTRNGLARARSSGEAASLHPRPGLQSAYVAPRDETEQNIANIWQRMLGIEQVGMNDNFFELGGHSLLATRLVAQLRADFALDLPLRRFFERPTISGLASVISELRGPKSDEEEILQMLAKLKDDEVDMELKRRQNVAN